MRTGASLFHIDDTGKKTDALFSAKKVYFTSSRTIAIVIREFEPIHNCTVVK
jgi:hypothetical protein